MRVCLEKHIKETTVQKMTIGTFPSICLQIYPGCLKISTVIDENEAVSIMEEPLKEMKLKISPKCFEGNIAAENGIGRQRSINGLFHSSMTPFRGFGLRGNGL